MKNILVLFSLLFFCCFSAYAQTPSKYKPTKYDSVKKVIPPQVYGNAKDRKKADSLANLQRIKEAEELKQAQLKLEAEKRAADAAEEAKKNELLRKKQEQEDLKKKKIDKPVDKKKNTDKVVPVQTDKVIQEREIKSDNRNTKSNLSNSSKWTLQKCIEYARDNNLQVAEAELNQRMVKLMYEQAKASRLPSVNADGSIGESYGRSIDPTSNQFVTKGFLYNSLGVSSQALVFGWFQKKYQIQQNQLEIAAADASFSQMKDDIALNVATGYLRILLAREQVNVNEAQLSLDNDQYEQTVKFANAGKLPELNVAQMLAKLSNDSAQLVAAKSDERIALLQLRALMNFNFEQNFDIQAPSLDITELASLYLLPNPEEIFNISVKNQHRMKYNQIKLLSAKKTLDISKAMQYPSLSIFGNIGTSFSSNVKDLTGQTYIGETQLGSLNIGGTSYPITRSEYNYSTRTRPLFNQYGDNIRANAGISLNVPILNGYVAKTNIQKAKIGLVSQQIAMDNDKQKLKQDIYTAYEQARASSQKYNAAKRSQDAAQRALDFAVKRFNAGMINTFEYTSIQNSLYTTSSTVLSTKYDLIFKLKVLDYYMGNPLKL